MASLFPELASDLFGRLEPAAAARQWLPAFDVFETDEQYVLLFDLPGIDPDAVDVEYENRVLTVAGERLRPEIGEARRVGRTYGEFTRSVSLPEGIDPDQIEADYRDGVLELRVRKPSERRPKRIPLGTGQSAR